MKTIYSLICAIFCTFIFTILSAPVSAGQDNFDAINLYNRAVDEAAAGKYEESLNLTSQALSIQPNFTLALITRIGVLLELGQVDQAERVLSRVVSIEPDNPEVLTAAASVYLKKGDFQETVRYTDMALEKDPAQVEAWIIKGTAHGELGEYSDEETASEKALAIDPQNEPALKNLQYAISKRQGEKKKTPLNGMIAISALGAGGLLAVSRLYR